MKRVLLIAGSALDGCPYMTTYMEVLRRNDIPFDFLFWNRILYDTNHLPDNYIPYNSLTLNSYPKWKKVYKIGEFASFARKQMKQKEYSFVVVCTIAHAVFLYPYLKSHYRGQYVFDIRDYSPLCKTPLLSFAIEKLVAYSAFTVLSSRGFLRWLPHGKSCHYIISHNTTFEALSKQKKALCPVAVPKVIGLLSIGLLRDFESNSVVISQLVNHPRYKLQFSGVGIVEELRNVASSQNASNIVFTGWYSKSDEAQIVARCDMLNNYCNPDIGGNSLMSNRFYHSVLFRKPMIVRKGSFQAEQVSNYGLGVLLDDNDDFDEKIMQWWNEYDAERYDSGCRKFISDVCSDLERFEGALRNLYASTSNIVHK